MKELEDIDNQEKLPKKDIVECCPHCQSQQFKKNGKSPRNQQKYKCKACHTVFTSLTGTVMSSIHNKAKFETYKKIMLSEDYCSIKSISKRVGISIPTAMDWRHKILCNLKIEDSTKFTGITEQDDIWFNYSQKGRKGLKYSKKRGGCRKQGDNDYQAKLLITADREKTADFSLVRIGRLQSSDISEKVGTLFDENSILVSDQHSSIKSFAKKHNINHY